MKGKQQKTEGLIIINGLKYSGLRSWGKGIDSCIMKAKKSHDLQSARWRTRKVGGLIWSQSKDVRTKSTRVQRQETMDVSAQAQKP